MSASTFGPTARLMAGAVMISFSPVFVKLAQVGPIAAGFYRTLIGGLVLLVITGLRKEPLWRGIKPFAWAVGAAVLFALDLSFWHQSVHLVGPGLSTILANFEVFFLAAIGGLLLGERVGLRLAVAIGLAMVGLYFLVGLHLGLPDAAQAWGVALGLLTAVCYTGYILCLRSLQRLETKPTPMANLTVVSLVCASLMGVEAWALGESLAIPDLVSGLALAGYGVAGQVVGWVLISSALDEVDASRAGLVLLLQPTLAFVWDLLFFSRPTDALGLMGAALALGAIYLGTIRR